MNNFNILGESSFENPYPSVIVAPDFATNIYPSINTAIANSSGIPQPFPGTFIATDFESQTQNSFNDTLQKIDNFQPSTLNQTNINGKLTTTDDITSTKFIVQGGTNIQYLLADGSTLTQSANSGNSNFYLYTSINTSFAPPITAGNVEYNNANQSLATIVYISHLTRDNIDIEIFFQNISTLNILYLQDQNDSTNYIRYDITGNATIVANSYISVPVAVIDSAGTGTTSFGTSHNILLSVFTNTQETNTRLSTVETKTQNITAVSNTTTFAGTVECSGLNMNTNKITNLATPTLNTDATTKAYVDTNIGTVQTTANNALPKAGGTMTGSINSLNILPVVTNTNSVGTSAFPYLNSETTTVNTKSLVVWNATRTFGNAISSTANSTFTMVLPPSQGALNSILRNSGGGALSWVSCASTLTQAYAAAEMITPTLFTNPLLLIVSNFVSLGNSNSLTVGLNGITITSIGVYEITLSCEINLFDANTTVEIQLNRGAIAVKLFTVLYSQNSVNGGGASSSYRTFYNKTVVGAEIINISIRRQNAFDTDVILTRAYMAISSIQ